SSGLFITTVDSSFEEVGVFEEWEFNAETGDTLSVRVEVETARATPKLRLRDVAGQTISSAVGDLSGSVRQQNISFSSPDTYRLRVFADTAVAQYWIRMELALGPQLKIEPNGSPAQANTLLPHVGSPSFSLEAAGALDHDDSSGDVFSLGAFDS